MGNNTIYMTTGASRYNGYLSNVSVPGSSNEKDNTMKLDQSGDCFDYNVYNTIGMATGSNRSYSGSGIRNGHENYCWSESWLAVNIPVAASGVVLSANEPNPTPPSCWDNVSAWAVFQSATLTGMTNNSNLKFELCRTSDCGANISGENGTSVQNIPILAIAGDALTAAALFCPFTSLAVAGVSLSTISLLSSMLPYSPYTSSQKDAGTPTLNGDGCLYQEMFIKGGKWASSGQTADSIPLGDYTNVYSSQEDYCLKIPCTEFLNNGCLNLFSSNLVVSKPDTQYVNLDRCSADCGSSVNLKIPIVPAYTISGQVASDGKGLANQQVLINEDNGGPYDCYFYVKTNSTGQFTFFAPPGASYDVCLADDKSYFYPLNVPYNDFNSSNFDFNVCPVTFVESGIASGQSWSVDFNGETLSSTSPTITFGVPSGSYGYSVSASGYTASPSSGTITVDSSSVTQDITFTGDYSVTFSESGLPSGSSWEAYLNNSDSYVYTTGTSVSLTAGNGQYSYAVPQASERQSNGDIYTYTASPSSGDVTVNGGSTTISVTFKLTSVSSGGGGGGTGCVNATTEVLMANFTYMQAQCVLPGDYVLAYNITTHAYQKEEVLDAYISNHSRLYTINGILQTSAYQPILTNDGYIQVQNLTTKDRIYDAFTGKYVKVTSITITNGNYTMYDFQIPPDYDFIAWEYVVYDLTIRP